MWPPSRNRCRSWSAFSRSLASRCPRSSGPRSSTSTSARTCSPSRSAWRRTLDAIGGMLSAYDTTTFWVGEYSSEMLSVLPEFAVADGIVDLRQTQRGTRDERFLRVLKLRGSASLTGDHPFHLDKGGLQAFRRFVTPSLSADYRPRLERLRSGIAHLDRWWRRDGCAGRRRWWPDPPARARPPSGCTSSRLGWMTGSRGSSRASRRTPPSWPA